MPGTRNAFAAVLLAVLACASVTSALAAEPRIALVIGNSAYADNPLANPANDARLMAAALRKGGFEVLQRTDVGRVEMALAIKEFGNRLKAAGAEAVGLFFYAGHGLQVGGRNYLLPVDHSIEDEGDVPIYSISADDVLAVIADARNRLNIIFLDACRNNPFARGFRSPVRGLAMMNAPTGIFIGYATAPGQVAADGSGVNSPFTTALTAKLVEPGVPIQLMFQSVREAVMVATNGGQVPWDASSLTGPLFYFTPAAEPIAVGIEPAPTPAPAPGFDARAIELSFWESIKDSQNASDFTAYLDQFPAGTFAALARNRLAALGESQIAVVTPPPPPPGIDVEPLNRQLVARRNANLRAGPSTDHANVGALAVGEAVTVTGKVAGRDWYRIALADGGEAYVWAPLLSEPVTPPPVAVVDPSLVVWEAIKDSDNEADFERFLAQYPNSPMTGFAGDRLAALHQPVVITPPPLPEPVIDPSRAVWEAIKEGDRESDFERFLAQYPNSPMADFARDRLIELRQAAILTPPPAPAPEAEIPAIALVSPTMWDGMWTGRGPMQRGASLCNHFKPGIRFHLQVRGGKITGKIAKPAVEITGEILEDGLWRALAKGGVVYQGAAIWLSGDFATGTGVWQDAGCGGNLTLSRGE